MDHRRFVNQAVVGVVSAVLACAAQADTIYVDDDNCPGPGSGTEGDPYCSIQTAIDNAVDTDEIIVAPGTYFETINFLGKAVTLRSADGPDVTILDAQGFGTVVTCNSGEGPDTVLEGLTITNGVGEGGGMRNDSSSPTVADCTFSGNTAFGEGGGMRNTSSSPTVTDCTFSANTADERGGGMYNSGGSLMLTGCTFSGNMAGDDGGGMYNSNAVLTVTGCTFTANSLSSGSFHQGGAIHNTSSETVLIGCTFTANWVPPDTSSTGGGAIISWDTTETIIDCEFRDNEGMLGGAVVHPDTQPPVEPLLVVNCSFIDNVSGAAGALHLQDTHATVLNCDIIGNEATNPDWGFGGGLLTLQAAVLTMINTRVTGNSAQVEGGGFQNRDESDFTFINCTIASNTAQGTGGGIHNLSSEGSGQVHNCILWGNVDAEGSGESAQIRVNAGDISVDYSLVQGLTGDLGGTGNIDADPLFVDPDNGDYRLSSSSPCIDAGDNTAVPEGITTDLDGNPRFVDDPDTVDTGYGDPPIVDMGAYEFQGMPCPWDLSGDGTVNVVDLLIVIASFGPCEDCPADFNDDGFVNVVDLLALIANFGPCPGAPCVWDVNGDGVVDQSDLQQVLDNFGPCDGCPEDVNGDGMVNGQDAAAVASHFGPCP